jgi:hypothetical protein
MARIIFPRDFLQQQRLFDFVKEKQESYPVADPSPLNPFLAEHGIDFTADTIAKDEASVFEETRSAKSNQAENFTQLRNSKFNPVFARLRNYAQFLKVLYKPAFKQAGNWGIPITNRGRINFPPAFAQRALIMDALQAKYDTYTPAGSSPLDTYLTQHACSIATDMAAVGDARTFHEQAKQLANEAEDATQDRNNKWNPVMDHLHAIAGFLMALYNNSPKEAGLWGFTVDHSPRAPKTMTTNLKLSSSITLNCMVLGSNLKNTGTVNLNVYNGKTTTGPFVTVAPGDVLKIAKGMSTITILNTSSTTKGIFSTIRNK